MALIEIVATCFLLAGQTYTPPGGWKIEQVGVQGLLSGCYQSGSLMHYDSLLRYPVERSYVVLRREAKIGEAIAAPPGCDVQVEMRK